MHVRIRTFAAIATLRYRVMNNLSIDSFEYGAAGRADRSPPRPPSPTRGEGGAYRCGMQGILRERMSYSACVYSLRVGERFTESPLQVGVRLAVNPTPRPPPRRVREGELNTAGSQPHPPAPSPTSQGGGAKHGGMQGMLRWRLLCSACVYGLRVGGRFTESPLQVGVRLAVNPTPRPPPRRVREGELNTAGCKICCVGGCCAARVSTVCVWVGDLQNRPYRLALGLLSTPPPGPLPEAS